MRDYLALVGAILVVLSGIPYIIDIVRRKTRPNIVSWFTWTLLIGIGAVATLAAGEVKTAIITFGDVTQVAIILLLGLRYGYAKLARFDIVCQISALVGLTLWLVFDSPTIAIVATIVVDLIASLPTFRHSWVAPQEETWQTFLISGVGAGVGLMSITSFNINSLAYPIYLVFLGVALSLTIIVRRRAKGIALFR